jgi:hypothetical protein
MKFCLNELFEYLLVLQNELPFWCPDGLPAGGPVLLGYVGDAII